MSSTNNMKPIINEAAFAVLEGIAARKAAARKATATTTQTESDTMLTADLRKALDEAMRDEFCRISHADYWFNPNLPNDERWMHPDEVQDAAEAHVIEEMVSFIGGWRNRWIVENQSE